MNAKRLSQKLTTGGLWAVFGGIALLFSVTFAGSGAILVAAGTLLLLFGVIIRALGALYLGVANQSGHI